MITFLLVMSFVFSASSFLLLLVTAVSLAESFQNLEASFMAIMKRLERIENEESEQATSNKPRKPIVRCYW